MLRELHDEASGLRKSTMELIDKPMGGNRSKRLKWREKQAENKKKTVLKKEKKVLPTEPTEQRLQPLGAQYY